MKQKPEASPLRFLWGDVQKRYQSSDQRLVSYHNVGNCLKTDSSTDNIKRDKKDMQALYESHTNPNLGVTMREKEILVVTASRIVVLWEKEVNKSSSYDSEGSKSTPIFCNITFSACVVHGLDFSQGTHSNMQEGGAITVSTKENPNIKKRRDEYLSPGVSYYSKCLGYTCSFGSRSEGGDCYARGR